MARTDDDTWDLATSVGSTATGVAVGRALASRGPDPLINDPFAEPLVRAVGVDFFVRVASGELDPAEIDDDDTIFGMRRMRDMMGARTRFFDDFFLGATDSGVAQVVILASGLDARAYRMSWPAGTTVYEIDQPRVIEFKTTALKELGAEPTTQHRPVGVDLRGDWPGALRRAGFDPARPSAFSAEGLLAFLPPEAQDRLLDNITALAAAGSRFASENMPPNMKEVEATWQSRMKAVTDRWREHGFDQEWAELWYPGERHDVGDYLTGRGWDITAISIAELFAADGLSIQPHDSEEEAMFNAPAYVTALR